MKHFSSLNDITSLELLIDEALSIKSSPYQYLDLGKHKNLLMLFFNSSLRTRLSTEKAARQLGMSITTMNVTDTWQLEFDDGVVMDLDRSEHIKDAAQVVSQYADMIAIRAFPTLKHKEEDEKEIIINSFKKYASIPVINLESATEHPLQALADAITITEFKNTSRPKVVLSWAPHPKALPQSVANSFATMMQNLDVDFSITHPLGYEINPDITKNTPVIYNQEEALKHADFVYVKNWSSYTDYGKILITDSNWMLTKEKLGHAHFMHCLPVRRNVVVEDSVLDSNQSLVIEQANNRTFAAQAVMKQLLEHL